MDQFQVLVGNYGIKPQGKSAPMASVKSAINAHNSKPTNSWNSSYGSSSRSKSIIDDHDDPFHFSSASGFQKQNNGGFGDLDIGFQFPTENNKFADGTSSGGSGLKFDVDSVFRESMNLGTKPSSSDDFDVLFSGFSGKNTSSVNNDDLLSSMPDQINPVDDLFGNLGQIGSGSRGSVLGTGSEIRKNKFAHEDELIPGFGSAAATTNGSGSGSRGSVPRAGSENRRNKFDHEDELIPGFGSGSATATNNGSSSSSRGNLGKTGSGSIPGFGSATVTNNGMNQRPKTAKKKPQEASFIDIESSSDSGGQYGTKEDEVNEWNFQAAAPEDAEVDLDSFFTAHNGKSIAKTSAATSDIDIDSIFSVPKPNGTSVGNKPIPVQKSDADIDSLFGVPNVKPGANTMTKSKNEIAPDFSSGTSSLSRNNLSSSSAAYDFDFFGGSMASGTFEEIEGEDDERRRARFGRYQRTEARMAQALADMNSREFQAQQEREERHRIAEIKDSEMKQWAAGKEGNLRALLSSLDQVLWPECGWKALSLADLITSAQVKVAYKKAALYVHPDKVQQKGATAQQKYVAEKVFDLLKEAWNKFNQEEMR